VSRFSQPAPLLACGGDGGGFLYDSTRRWHAANLSPISKLSVAGGQDRVQAQTTGGSGTQTRPLHVSITLQYRPVGQRFDAGVHDNCLNPDIARLNSSHRKLQHDLVAPCDPKALLKLLKYFELE
jgi:hypothetical protein